MGPKAEPKNAAMPQTEKNEQTNNESNNRNGVNESNNVLYSFSTQFETK